MNLVNQQKPGREHLTRLERLKEIGKTYFCVYSQRGNLFFEANFQSGDRSLTFTEPAKFHRVQRRKHLRILVFGNVHASFLSVDGFDKKTERQILDLCSQGVGLLVKPDEVALYTEGLRISDLEFKIRGHQVRVDAFVRHVGQTLKTHRLSGMRMGLEFINLDEPSQQAITTYILEKELPSRGKS